MRAEITGALCAVAVLLGGSPARADGELSVSVSISERKVLVGDVFSLQVRSVARVQGDIRVEVPRVKGLVELSRSSSEGTSISWSSSGGQQITREQTLALELQANEPGTLRIPPVVARVGGHVAQSQPVTIEVIGQDALTQSAAKAEAGEVAPPDPSERDIFVRYRLDKANAYLGEQVLLDLEVFAASNRNFSLEEVPGPPELDGFWKEIVYKPDRLTRRVETVGGRRYSVYRVWRVAMFGLTAGERTLPPVRLTFSSGGGFFRNGQRMRVRTKPVKLTIEPLPTEGRPRGFVSTNVGQYQLSTKVDSTVVPAGKAVVLTVSLSGSGNVSNSKLPEVPEIDGFRAFPPNTDAKTTSDITGVRGTKTAEILLMPTRGGRLEIPALTLPVFDPEKAEYRRLSAPSIRVVVKGEPSPSDDPTVDAAPAPKKKGPAKLEPVHVRAELSRWSEPPFSRPTYWGALAAPPALFVLLLLLGRLMALSRRQTPGRARRRVAADAKARLTEARAHAEGGRLAEAYAAFVAALNTLGSERLQVALQGLTTEQVADALSLAGAAPELVDEVKKELETADYARFAPGALAGTDVAALLERWGRILTEVEALEKEGGA